jgi:hypothetical protein
MARPRKGFVSKDKKSGKWVARVTLTSPDGRRKNITRKHADKAEARKILKTLLSGLEESKKEETKFNDRTTFAQLADKYQEIYLIPPKYVGDKKVAGLRSYESQRIRIKKLREHFFKTPVKTSPTVPLTNSG